MTASFDLTMKRAFRNQLAALGPQVTFQVTKKLDILESDPFADGHTKKKLHTGGGELYRLRSGNYRILYAIGDGWVCLLGVDDRKDVYDNLGNLVYEPPRVASGPSLEEILGKSEPQALGGEARGMSAPAGGTVPSADDRLPVALDESMLRRLRVPESCFVAILACTTFDELFAADVPEPVRETVWEAVESPDLHRALTQPDEVVTDVDDLMRYVEGELLGFLLRLSPEQERYVTRAVRGAGPTLVKGAPGTGKSTVALYRARAMVAALRADGIARPRLLFTTYTNALVTFSRQLLNRLLGDDAPLVEVRTADSVVIEVVRQADGTWTLAEDQQIRQLVERAVKDVVFDGNALQRRAQALALERLDTAYLLTEIETVIVARELATLDEYLGTSRAGRQVALAASSRTAVWRVHEALERLLGARGLTTWSRLRRRASELVRAGKGPEQYDGVLIDEAQDLEPAALRTLVGLCRSTDRLFVTADANQSIYGSGFRWTDIHGGLRFTGRTGVLRKNYRSTQEIGEAAHAYLAYSSQDGRLEADDTVEVAPREYVERGMLPVVRSVASPHLQTRLLAMFIKAAARDCRLGKGACAVLVPTRKDGLQVAGGLRDAGLDADFMASDALDLDAPCVKVLTLRSAKGLEFPIVAIAGLLDDPAPGVPGRGDASARQEALLRERRTMFVGMTRAMRALLVVTPAEKPHKLLEGFDPRYWNL